ncbi:MAG: T9SS type A sorting domain-containing protein, partial [Saprospiraceae bacterium]|nr:T9SS type A sorting domain-containing protein [Saprospiraceae bacterium]
SATATVINEASLKNVWQLWCTNTPGATSGGTLISTVTVGLSVTFNGLNVGKHYYIRHRCVLFGSPVETVLAVPDFTANATVDFLLEDDNGIEKSTFCVGEAIFLDGTGSVNYDRFYLSAGRRPAGSAPGTPFTGYADYGWTMDNSIGVLNLTNEFLTNGENPGEVFEPGYEYEVLLAIANPPNCIPWMELKKTFTVVCCNVNPAFTVQSSCNNGNWIVLATPGSSSETNHVWQLYETTTAGATTGGTPVGPAQTGTSGSFSWLDHSKFYYIKHSTGFEGCEILMASVAVTGFQANANLTYVLTDRNGVAKDNFCYGEDIFLDPTGTSNYDRFFMSVWRRPNGSTGNFELYGDYGWTYTNNIGILNLSHMFRSKGENPGEIFEPGYVYELQFAIANPQNCIPWIELKRQFRVVCCEDFFSAYFGLDMVDGGAGLELWAHSFGNYGNYATHNWLVLSSPNPSGGPYTYVGQSFSSGPGPILLYNEGVSGLYYFVVHRVSTLCGDYCYGKQREGVNYQTTSGTDGGEQENDCELCGEIDCAVVDGLCFPPGNLRIYGTHFGHLTAYWNAVPGATQYVVEITINDPRCCERGGEPITYVQYTTSLGQYLGILDDYCLSVRVGAICSDEGTQWTDILCLSGDNLAGPGAEDRLVTSKKGESDTELVVYPNPANEMVSILIPQGKTAELVQFLDIQGRVVIEQQNPDQRLEVDSSTLPAGIYAIHVIYTDRSQSVQKVQISH